MCKETEESGWGDCRKSLLELGSALAPSEPAIQQPRCCSYVCTRSAEHPQGNAVTSSLAQAAR